MGVSYFLFVWDFNLRYSPLLIFIGFFSTYMATFPFCIYIGSLLVPMLTQDSNPTISLIFHLRGLSFLRVYLGSLDLSMLGVKKKNLFANLLELGKVVKSLKICLLIIIFYILSMTGILLFVLDLSHPKKMNEIAQWLAKQGLSRVGSMDGGLPWYLSFCFVLSLLLLLLLFIIL